MDNKVDLKKFLAERAYLNNEDLIKSIQDDKTAEEWIDYFDNSKVTGGKVLHGHLVEEEFRFLISVMESVAIANAAHGAAEVGGDDLESLYVIYLTQFVKEHSGEMMALISIIAAMVLGVALDEGWVFKTEEPDIHVPDL